MWLAPLIQVLVLAGAAPPATPPAATQAGPAPIYTRQTLFAIPFRIDRPDRITQEPAEVQLFYSGDRGARWELYARAKPSQQHFLFRAGTDGEYWFHVRTVDRSGQFRTDTQSPPGLKVIVDTTPPKLQLDARRGDAGQIAVRWQTEELHPKPDSLTIQYRVGPSAAWQPVALGRQDARSAGAVQTGEVTLWPPVRTGTLEIRAETADLAGNPAVSNAQVNLSENRVAAPGANWPAQSARAADRPTSDRYPPAGGSAGPTSPSGRTQVALSVDGQKSDPPPAAVAIRVNPPIRNQYVAPDETGRQEGDRSTVATQKSGQSPDAMFAAAGVPPGEKVRAVNAKVFELEYDTESVGPSGISRVELWGTRDGGRTWRSFGTDEDRRSPIVVNVDDEGIYGFRISVQSGAGLGGRAPQKGDLPEVWIGVDLTKPTARITAAQQGTGAEAGRMNITWEASDNMKLADRPISLSFSTTRGGPWTPIASGLENTGRHNWTLDSRLPPRVYLRLEARDDAGNVGVYEMPEPVSIDRTMPSARILEVRPLGQSGTPSDERYYVR